MVRTSAGTIRERDRRRPRVLAHERIMTEPDDVRVSFASLRRDRGARRPSKMEDMTTMITSRVSVLVAWAVPWLLGGTPVHAQPQPAPRPRSAPAKPVKPSPSPAAPSFFTTPLTADQMAGKQAVVETSAGTFVIALLPAAAPNHVGHFMKLAQEGAYEGTTFHRMIPMGIVQGGDPLSKDPAKREQYGTGGLNLLRAEFNAEKHTRGAVSAVLTPTTVDSGGQQFFICVTDQVALDGKYTVFARVVEGIEVVEKISSTPVDASGKAVERVTITAVTIRETPPPEVPPFSTETVEELSAIRAVLETSLGDIRVELFADRAPNHVRNFLRLAQVGAYEGTGFHRVVPGFVVQTGSMAHRASPLTQRQQQYVGNLAPEFSPTKHEKGILSMARGDDPNSATTSFFICTAAAPALDGQYSVFGRVIDGLAVVEAIESVPVAGETPVTPVELKRVRVERDAP